MSSFARSCYARLVTAAVVRVEVRTGGIAVIAPVRVVRIAVVVGPDTDPRAIFPMSITMPAAIPPAVLYGPVDCAVAKAALGGRDSTGAKAPTAVKSTPREATVESPRAATVKTRGTGLRGIGNRRQHKRRAHCERESRGTKTSC